MKVNLLDVGGRPLRATLHFRDGRSRAEGTLRGLCPCRGGFEFSLAAPSVKPRFFQSQELDSIIDTLTGEIHEPALPWLRMRWLNEVETEYGGIPLAHAIASLGLHQVGRARAEALARYFGYWDTLWQTVRSARAELESWASRDPKLSRARIITAFADPAFVYTERLYWTDFPSDAEMPSLAALLLCDGIGAESGNALLEAADDPDSATAFTALQNRTILPHQSFALR